MEHTYSCDVYNAKLKLWDCYWVNAKTPEEAYLTCRDRLDNETDNPEDWEIVTTIEEDTGLGTILFPIFQKPIDKCGNM